MQLREYQVEGRDFLRSRKYAMLGDACGVGKTAQAIMAIDPSWKSILIVCPASVKYQWQAEIKRWIWQDSFVVSSSDQVIPISKILITNYDLMIKEKVKHHLYRQRYDLIIFDEAHKLKSMTSKRSTIALGEKGLRARTNRIWFLTGTPVKNRTVDLFPILKSCATEYIKPYDKFYRFVYHYCGAYKNHFGVDVSGASNTEELCMRLKKFMLRREKRDVLDELPPRVLTRVELDCTPEARKIIEAEELKTIEQAGDSDPALFKLGEIVRIRKALAKHKVPASVEYIKDLLEEEDKIVVFYHHKEVLGALQQFFHSTPHVHIDGSVAAAKRRGLVEEFRKRKEVRLFFGQMEACGEGIDGLQDACSCCVFVEPSWSHTDIEQCIGRLERSGQRNNVNVHILTIKNTLEARMMEVVAMKIRVDKKLYNQKENQMANATPVNIAEKIVDLLDKLTQVLDTQAQILARLDGQPTEPEKKTAKKNTKVDPESQPKPQPRPEPKSEPEPEEVESEADDDVTEDSIRARAADIVALNSAGKQKCIEIIKKIGGGKIADLKTPEMRKKCLAALDNLYNELSSAL